MGGELVTYFLTGPKGVLTRERVPKLGYAALRDTYAALPDYRPEAALPGER